MRGLAIGALILITAASSVCAGGNGGNRDGGGTHKSYSSSHGIGSKSTSTYVHGHTRKDGTYVKGHRRSASDHNFTNNWTTKGNDNPYTGKEGSRVIPPANR